MSAAFAWAQAADLPSVLELLRRCELPADLRATADCLLARDGGAVVGCVALERYGNDALLRSLAVGPEQRGEGLGRALVERVTRRARTLGARRIWLLTTTADRYFESLGYARVERASAPARMQAGSQFAGVCPSSAVCMARTLKPVAHGKPGKAAARKSRQRA